MKQVNFVELHTLDGQPFLVETTGLLARPPLKDESVKNGTGSFIVAGAYGKPFGVKESYSQIRKMIYGES